MRNKVSHALKSVCLKNQACFAGSIAFQISAASAPPQRGATINTQRSDRACPPSNKAGPMLRAGFTEVPV